MSDQWGAPASQPDGSWPPQPTPTSPYPHGPSQQYPSQPPAPAAPAGPYAADPYSGQYSAQHAGPYAQQQPASGLNWGPAQDPQPSYGQTGYPTPDPYASSAYAAPAPPAAPANPMAQPQQAPPRAPQHAQAPQAQPQPRPRPQPQPEPQYQYQQSAQSASHYTSVPPAPSAYPPETSYPSQPAEYAQPSEYSQPAEYPQPAAFPQSVPYPQAPGGLPIEAPAGQNARPTNPFAVIGAVTSIVPFVGLIFSIIGLGKAKVIGGIGRGVATLGVVLSLIFIPGWSVAGYLVYKAVDAAPTDPACVTAEADYLSSSRTLDADAAAMAKTTYGTRQFTNAVKTYESDFQVLIEKLEADSGRAESADVHTAITSLTADLQQLKTVMGDLASGDFTSASRLGDISTLSDKMFTDYEHTQNVCAGHAG
ncbi:DUF4190 domain-containing protein [Actinospica robiniae]|uniref:DUF4190 domain-containing protein n=1 Tax=Actinospica robiniae TaxID=304901 RepID=UPI0003F90BB0|nr:DUF4190 domain-containing protein [Actinospica robiniae]